ncbi:hypothetical protein D3C71_1825530 [compost metagenome]
MVGTGDGGAQPDETVELAGGETTDPDGWQRCVRWQPGHVAQPPLGIKRPAVVRAGQAFTVDTAGRQWNMAMRAAVFQRNQRAAFSACQRHVRIQQGDGQWSCADLIGTGYGVPVGKQ